ncbi:MAG: hypothetical protein ACM309_02565 [Bacillota bacterium]
MGSSSPFTLILSGDLQMRTRLRLRSLRGLFGRMVAQCHLAAVAGFE